MEKELNIAAILKDKPVGLKFYSPTFGCVTFNGVHKDKVYFFSKDTNAHSVKQNGKMFDDGECIIFPSKEMRDWFRFAWKKGDVLIMDGYRVVFDKWLNDDYTRFNAVHLITSIGGYIDKPLQNRYSPISNFITRNWRKMTDAETKIYMDSLERECGGKLNRETLEVEKAQPEFKDGDIVVYECEINDIPSTIFIFRGINQFTPYYSYYACLSSDGFLSYKLSEFGIYNRELRFATEAEKSQLFSALAKAKKVWIPEKKQIVNLNPKVELKPFDKVLVRDFKDQAWQVSLFGYKDANNYYCCNGSCWDQCIPYIGNESLLGTTKDVEG